MDLPPSTGNKRSLKILHSQSSRCRLGIARCDITPPVGIYHRLWGAAKHDRATGIHRPLTATALVFQPHSGFQDPAQQFFLIALDHCLLWMPEINRLLKVLAQKGGLPADNLVLAFSHTHAGGLMDPSRTDLPGGELISPYLDLLADQLGGVIRKGLDSIVPVTITHGQGRCDMAANRDFWDEDHQQFVCGLNPNGERDDAVLVARVSDDGGKTIAILVNYACHPTTLAWDNTLISPDFPGAMREVVEQTLGAPCVFFQGASGDLGPRQGFVGDPAVADRNGRQLGYAVLSALEGLPPPGCDFAYQGPVISGATLGTWKHQPWSKETAERKCSWRLDHFTVPLPYRAGLPTPAEIEAQLQTWTVAEQQAPDDQAGRDARAMIERWRRMRTRLQHLPTGEHFPMPVHLLKMGDALWLTVEGEPYQWLQKNLRARNPGQALWILTLCNGARCSYLPTSESFNLGIYQESIAVLEKGCLEELARQIDLAIKA